MKMCINGISVKSFAMAIAIAVFSFSASVAQVSVNAPSGLTKRSSAAASGKSSSSSSTPAASAPAASTPAPAKAKSAPAKASGAQRQAAPKKGTGGVAVDANGSVANQTVIGQITGYRVQVLFSSAKNGRAIGQERAKKIALKYPQYRAYMTYVAPRWRLRFGDFKTYEDARVLANLIKNAFPEWRTEVAIVTDKINKFK